MICGRIKRSSRSRRSSRSHRSAPNEHVVSSFEANTRTTMDEQLRAAQLAGARPPALAPPPQGAPDPPRRARPGAGYMQPTAVQASAPEELALLAVRRGYIPTHSSRVALTHGHLLLPACVLRTRAARPARRDHGRLANLGLLLRRRLRRHLRCRLLLRLRHRPLPPPPSPRRCPPVPPWPLRSLPLPCRRPRQPPRSPSRRPQPRPPCPRPCPQRRLLVPRCPRRPPARRRPTRPRTHRRSPSPSP